MANVSVTDAKVVSKATMSENGTSLNLALFKEDGTPLVPQTTVMPVQAASAAATVGALVTDFNALLTKLKAAGYMANS